MDRQFVCHGRNEIPFLGESSENKMLIQLHTSMPSRMYVSKTFPRQTRNSVSIATQLRGILHGYTRWQLKTLAMQTKEMRKAAMLA
jgi:hypothetical protein